MLETIIDSQSTLSRLSRMRWPELAGRCRQEILKRIDQVTASRGAGEAAPDTTLERFVCSAEGSFQGAFDQRVPAVLAIQAPEYCKEMIAAADKLCKGRFDLLGFRDLDFGSPPAWNLDPVSGRRAPLLHWSRLEHLDVGDRKVIWELNRHQWMVHLGQAYRLTREERYAESITGHLRSWLEANPKGMGINWSSSLEAALRVISWCWALLLIRDSKALTESAFQEVGGSIQAHAQHIERYLSYYFSPNTHLTGEALGLLYVSLLFPDLKRAKRWRSLATRILLKQIERQVLSDGVYFERSTWYQRYTVDTYLHFLILASRAGLEAPTVVNERVRSMLDFLVALRQPDGSMPSIGDADGGWLLPLSRTRPEDFRATFSTAAVLFESPQYAWAAGEFAPDTLWLLGTPALETFQTLGPSPPQSDACRLFPDGGFAVMRSGWDGKNTLIFDTGPLGCHLSSGHGHADMLSIQCSAFGRPYLVDPGTCCYTASEELRDFFRGTTAHSSVVVDGKDQAQPAGPFAWQSRPATELLDWISNDDLAFADAEHDGYRALPDPVSHRRRVIFVKPRYWLVIDDLIGEASHRIEVRFQFAPVHLRIDSMGWARATVDGRHGLLMRALSSVPLRAGAREGRREPLEGWISPNYGQIEPAPALVYVATTLLPARVVTLLWPSERVHQETPRVKGIRERDGRVSGLELLDRAETVMFGDGAPTIERAVPQRVRALAAF